MVLSGVSDQFAYSHDALYRLDSESYSGSGYSATCSYDAAGNISDFSYDADNKITNTGFSYDGDLTASSAGDGAATYAWDDRGVQPDAVLAGRRPGRPHLQRRQPGQAHHVRRRG